MPTSDSNREVLLERLAEEFVERHRRGECPALTEYTDRHPDLAADIRDLFPALAQIERLKPVTGDYSGSGAGPTTDGPRLQRLGEYRILREVGSGGMGVVYEAEQESLGRHVALKVLPPQSRLNATYLERFRREARAAAKLHHTNIVPVFGVGEADGVPYYAMQFIHGEGLDKVLADLRRLRLGDTAAAASGGSMAHGLLSGQFAAPAPAADAATQPLTADVNPGSTLSGGPASSAYHRSVAQVGVQVADALAHAHAQGILHRDIKPSNLLLDGQGRVWVTDFGLAKADGADELTHTGDIVGTLRFMASERFDGRSLPQSDIYGLGLTLYELLTLRPAFDDTNKARLIEKVLHEPPPPPRKLDPRVPRDLETIVLKCAAKDAAERYASAGELAEDLRRFLADRPIQARRSSTVERTWRWCRRNPWLGGLSAAVLVLLTVTAVGGAVMTLWLNDALGKMQTAEREGKRKLFLSYLSDADATRISRRPGQRFNALRRIRDALAVGREIGLTPEDTLKLRNIAIAALCLPDIEPVSESSSANNGSRPGEVDPIQRHQARAFAALNQLPPPAIPIPGSSWFSLDGRFIAVRSDNATGKVTGPVQVWRIDGAQPVLAFRVAIAVHQESVSFRPDGRHVAFGHGDRSVSIYDLVSSKIVKQLDRGVGPAYCLAYHPTLPRLAVANGQEVAVWDTEAEQRLVRLDQPTSEIAVAWHPSGHHLATASNRQIQLWHADTWQPATPPWQGHAVAGIRLSFDHSGCHVASNAWDNIVRIWDAASGQLLLSHPYDKAFFRFGAGDQLVGASPSGGSLGVATGREQQMLLRQTARGPVGVWRFALHPGGRLLAALTGNDLRFFDLRSRREVGSVEGHFTQVAFDAGGTLWTAGGAGLVRWPVRPSESSNLLRIGPPEWVSDLAYDGDDGFGLSADGLVLALPFYLGGARVIHRGLPRRAVQLGPQSDVRTVNVSPDGRWIVTGTHEFDTSGVRYKVWDADTGRQVAALPSSSASGFGGFTPDSRAMYFMAGHDVVCVECALLFDGPPPIPPAAVRGPERREELRRDSGRPGVSSKDGRLRAYAAMNGGILLVDARLNEEVARIPPPTNDRMEPRTFGADDSLLLTYGTQTQAVYVFDLDLIRKQLAELGLDWGEWLGRTRSIAANDPSHGATVRVELIEPGSATGRAAMAEAERRRATLRLSIDPFDADAHFRLGWSLGVAKQFDAAYDRLAMAQAFNPGLTEALHLRADIAARAKRWDDAVAEADRYLTNYPFEYWLRWVRARSHQMRQRYDAAIADLSVLCTERPGIVPHFDARAECYDALGKSQLAKADRQHANALGGMGVRRLNSEAWKLVAGPVGQRDPVKAHELIRKALDIDPGNFKYLNTLGVVQYRNGQYPEAIATLQKSLAASAGTGDGFDLFFLSMCHARLRDPAKAKDYFDRAVRWTEARKGTSEKWAGELKEFRAEAEAELRNP